MSGLLWCLTHDRAATECAGDDRLVPYNCDWRWREDVLYPYGASDEARGTRPRAKRR